MQKIFIHKDYPIKESKDITMFIFTFLLSVLIAFVSFSNILICDLCTNGEENFNPQNKGQEFVHLFGVIPFLVFSSVFAYQGIKTGLFVWCGTLLYIMYDYTKYSIDIQYNYNFIAYFFILGLAIFSLMLFTAIAFQQQVFKSPSNKFSLKNSLCFLFINAGVLSLFRGSEIISNIMLPNITGYF